MIRCAPAEKHLSLKKPGTTFVWVRVIITTIDADMTQAEKEQFLKDIDARCPISDNIHNLTDIEFVVEEELVTA